MDRLQSALSGGSGEGSHSGSGYVHTPTHTKILQLPRIVISKVSGPHIYTPGRSASEMSHLLRNQEDVQLIFR